MSEGAAVPLLKANQKWLGPGGESVLLQKEQDIIVYYAYDAKTGTPALQMSTVTWGHMLLHWMAMPRLHAEYAATDQWNVTSSLRPTKME